MKAVGVFPGKPNTAHMTQLPMPTLEEIPEGKGVLVRVLQVGLCGTDREIIAGAYGAPPAGYDFLVPGHENFGVVEQVGSNVTQLKQGDYVVALVRQPGDSIYDDIGMSDLTTSEDYYEHGISLVHGFLTEYYVVSADRLIQLPPGLRHVGVLVEPLSVVEKAISQAYEIQRRLRVWQPRMAAVLGAGPIGLLATLVLRLRSLDVITLGLEEPPYLNSDLVETLGGRYTTTRKVPLKDASAKYGPFDLILEATGYSPLVFEAMDVLGKNGVLILTSVTGGDRKVEVPADSINRGFVLGNKVAVGSVNANREHYQLAVRDLAMAEAQQPGWLSRLLTHPVRGLENYQEAFDLLTGDAGPVKVYVEVAPLE